MEWGEASGFSPFHRCWPTYAVQGGIKIVPSSCDDLPAVSCQLSAVSCQLSAVSCQLSAVSTQHSERQGPPSTCKNLKAGIDLSAPLKACKYATTGYRNMLKASTSRGLPASPPCGAWTCDHHQVGERGVPTHPHRAAVCSRSQPTAAVMTSGCGTPVSSCPAPLMVASVAAPPAWLIPSTADTDESYGTTSSASP